VESALADFYEETAKAAQIRTVARERAEKLLATAEEAAAAPEEAEHDRQFGSGHPVVLLFR
jgi:hypothetical protein